MSDYGNYILDKIYDDKKFPLGAEVQDGQARFRFVKYNSGAGDVTAAAGKVGYVVGPDTTGEVPWEVTMDYSSAAAATAYAIPVAAAGFFQAALTDGKFGWVQISGYNRQAATTLGSVSRGDQLSVSTTDGAVITLAAGSPDLPSIGKALADDSGTTLAAGSMLITI